MSAQASNPRDPNLSPDVVAAIREALDAHPFWSYDKLADHLQRAGHRVTALGVAWVQGSSR